MTLTAQNTHGTTSRRVANELRAEILGGRMPPGTRIRQEEIAAQLGASRVPVREALRILEADGLVTLVANTGAWVSTISLAESRLAGSDYRGMERRGGRQCVGGTLDGGNCDSEMGGPEIDRERRLHRGHARRQAEAR